MEAKVYYQDFHLNAAAYNHEDLVLDTKNATPVYEITAAEVAKATGVHVELIGKQEMAGGIWQIMNHLEIPVEHPDRPLFEKAGHTSMSKGDYIDFGDEIWVAASMGWKILPQGENEDRVRCTYPMSNFYNFEDEVPAGTRVSTTADCEACSDECGLRYCLFQDEKWKKCLNHCPKCDAADDDIDWGSKDSDGSTSWQEAECKKCGCVFQEVFEYTATMIK